MKRWLVLVVVLASCWRNERPTATPPAAPSPDAAVSPYACYTWTREERHGTSCARFEDCQAHRDRAVSHKDGASYGPCRGSDAMSCFHSDDATDGPEGIDVCFATEEECELGREATHEFAMTSDWHCTANP